MLTNAISVDVEDYFHTEAMSQAVPRGDWEGMPSRVERNTGLVLDCFARRGVKATFFFLGWVAERFPALVRRAVAEGHEVACHSYWHCAVFRLSPDEFREDTLRAKSIIEHHAQEPVVGYRAPSFSITPQAAWAFDILGEMGFLYDSSVHPIRHDFYSNHSAERVPNIISPGGLVEFPIATWRVWNVNVPVGGGAYLRVFPYAITKRGISAMNKSEGIPAVTYFHPWEIDPEQPRLRVSRKSRLRQYTNLSRMMAKLERLLTDFRFTSIQRTFDSRIRPEKIADLKLALEKRIAASA